MTLASFLSSGTQHAILNGLAFFAFVLWLSLGYWTYKDAKRRICLLYTSDAADEL